MEKQSGAPHQVLTAAQADMARLPHPHELERLTLLSAALAAFANAAIVVDRGGTIVWANPAIEQLTGYTPDEVVGQNTRIFKSGHHPACFYESLWATVISGQKWQGQIVNRRKDGRFYHEEMTITPVCMWHGPISHFLAIKQDITERKSIEERMARFCWAVENSSELIAMGDTEAKITFANEAWLRNLGYTLPEVMGKPFSSVFSPNNPPNISQEIRSKTLSGGWRGEIVHLRKDGTEVHIVLSTGTFKDSEGQPAGVFGIGQDVTERKREEEEVQFKTALLQAQAETTMDGILVVNESEKIVFSNRRFAALWGIPQELIRTLDDRPLRQYVTDQIAEPQAFQARVKYLYEHKEEKSEDELWLKDGRCLDRYSSPLVDSAGRYWGRIWYFRDITARKHTEDEVRRLALMVENSFNLIATADLEGKFVYMNRGFVQALGYASKEDLAGKQFNFIMDCNPQSILQDMVTHMREPAGWTGDCLLRRRDGTDFPCTLTVQPVMDQQGHVIGTFGIAQDIRERKRAEESLRQSEEQFRQLAENITQVLFVCIPEPLQVKYISPAYDEIWGRPRQELYANSSGWVETIHPEDRERSMAIFGQSLKGAATTVEYRIVRPDGAIRWIRVRTFPVRDTNGTLCRLVGIAEDVTARTQEEKALREVHAKLNLALAQAEAQAQEAAKLSELVDLLQSCQSLSEAYLVIASVLKSMLSPVGVVYITSPSRNIVEAMASWGDAPASEKTFRPDECWALRRGKVHPVAESNSPLSCAHVTGLPPDGYLCVPLSAQGETLGILYLEYPPHIASASSPETSPSAQRAAQTESILRQATAVGERVSLALGNLRLREALRSQSIRDPLTGLFNRRYMEESLEREISRAERSHQPVSILMMDIDRFKQFNDTFGHLGGDALLRAFGSFVTQHTRGQDVACRYGGEEFAIILAGASTEAAVQRAEMLRIDMQQLIVQHSGQVLGKVTLSIGVATAPEHCTAEELLRAADASLYRAKSEGRNRVVS